MILNGQFLTAALFRRATPEEPFSAVPRSGSFQGYHRCLAYRTVHTGKEGQAAVHQRSPPCRCCARTFFSETCFFI